MTERKEAKVRWIEGLQFVGEADSGHAVVLDAASEERPRSTAAGPMEFVLIGLATCSAMDIVGILSKRRKELKRFEVVVHANRAAEYPRIFTDIELEFVVAGDFTPAEVERAIELSQTKYCSVAAMLRPTVKITTTYRIEAA